MITNTNNIVLKLVAFLFLIATMNGCSSITVTSDWDQEVDFSQLKSFTFIEDNEPAINRLIDQRIRDAIVADLTGKGLKQVDGYDQADLAIGFDVATEQRRTYQTMHSGGWGASGFRTGGFHVGASMGTSTTRPVDFTVGTLVIAIFKVNDKTLVWQGTGSDTVNPSSNPEQSTQQINNAVQQILEQFPPGVKAAS
ncbi:MAG: DUF4136 domain-containing protein [Gammaproteobacteria bacterium]|nr:DUF4136 domain-containing protein [Gammaproteobacteria bacterium]